MSSFESAVSREHAIRASLDLDLTAARALAGAATPLAERVMSFEAPYVLEKLVHKGVVQTEPEARALFDEVKRYLLLSQHLRKPLPMSSSLVDAAWHQFVLFTREYERFCRSCLGEFCHHVPAPIDPASARAEDEALPLSEEQFRLLYEASFGRIPDVWYDSLCLRADTRLSRRRASDVFCARMEEAHALLYRDGTELVCRASARAFDALDFIAQNSFFLVRELPRLKAPEEHVALCRPLVRYGILRIAV